MFADVMLGPGKAPRRFWMIAEHGCTSPFPVRGMGPGRNMPAEIPCPICFVHAPMREVSEAEFDAASSKQVNAAHSP